MITITEAIQSLVPNAPAHYISTTTNKIVGWDVAEEKTGIPQPTQAEIDAEIVRLQAEYDSQEYARNRKAEYDQLNQFEMQFDDDRDGTTTWVDTINEIKGRHPK
jgi:hypothetical protein